MALDLSYRYGMAKMTRRTTFALDEETVRRLKKLATLWHVSQAEVVRKVVEKAENELRDDHDTLISSLKKYQSEKRLKREQADAYLETVAYNRADWGR